MLKLEETGNADQRTGTRHKTTCIFSTQFITSMSTVNAMIRTPIKRVQCEHPDDFLNTFAKERIPLVINGVTDQWPAFGKWSLDYFENSFADLKFIPSVNLPEKGTPFEKVWCDHTREMTVKEFINFMRSSDKPCYMHRQHIRKFPGAENDINFDDLLPGHSGNSENFMWIGSAGTRTGLHFDFEDNMLCQMYGTKQVSVISPEDSNSLYPYKDSITKSRVTPENPDLTRYKKFAEATVYEDVIGPGDILFIPRHWWHSVVSLEPSISISHNYGEKLSLMDFMRAINAAGPLGWLTVTKDLCWHGVLRQKFNNRLFDDPPFGKLLYGMAAYAIKKRLYSAAGA